LFWYNQGVMNHQEGEPLNRSITAHLANSGQAMLITVLTIGAVLLGATSIAGLLMVYQLRQNSDFANSAKAIFAADAGLEWGLYASGPMVGQPLPSLPTFANGASVEVTCYDGVGNALDCNSDSVRRIRAVGKSARSSRALEANF